MAEILRLRADGLGLLFTTHDPNQAARYADRALLFAEAPPSPPARWRRCWTPPA